MSVIQNNLLMTPEGYQISRSVRLRSSASAYFNRTFGTATFQTTFTVSAWLKRGKLGAGQTVIGASGAQFDGIYFNTSDQLIWYVNGTTSIVTTAAYRDPSAWYHVVLKCAGASSVLYVNNQQVGTGSTAAVYFNTAISHIIGQNSATNYLDGYLTEVNFIDGQALTPSSFGETDAVTGVWKPKKYAGTYGTNGFYLNFSDNSAATAAAIGKDSSGNGNNWTPNNVSVTAGVTYDSMLDVPTMWADGGNGRGNYAVFNPLDTITQTLSNANLTVTASSSVSSQFTRATTQIPTTGKWYWECVSSGGTTCIGITVSSVALVLGGSTTYNNTIDYQGVDGNKNVNGTVSAYGATYGVNDVIGVAVNADAGTLTFYKNNVSQGSISITVANGYSPNIRNYSSVSTSANFGQRPFAYTPPTGFKALNTQNLPEATIKKGNQYFDATTYTGNGGTQSIVNSGAMQPDLVWIKNRTDSITADHVVKDSERGSFWLYTNTTDAEISSTQPVLSVNGFSLNSSANRINASGDAYVGWQWKESVTAGFDIVTYTGTGVNRTIAHSLGVAPKMIIAKHRNAVDNWIVYHASLGGSPDYLWLNLTSAKGTSSAVWNTAPTSSVFGVGTDNLTNISGGTYVAYLFSEVAGYSKFGSYTGNGSTDGPFVYLGFRPRYIMWKRTDSTADWTIFDTSRGTYNVQGPYLIPNTSGADTTDSTVQMDFLSNGFKVRGTWQGMNASGGTFIYAAFAENPFKNSLAR